MDGALGWFTGAINNAISAAGNVFTAREQGRAADDMAARDNALAQLAEKERTERTRMIVFAAVGIAALAVMVARNRRGR